MDVIKIKMGMGQGSGQDEDGDQDIFTLFFYDGGCNYFSQLNYEGILGNGFFWRNDNGVLVQTEYEFCL